MEYNYIQLKSLLHKYPKKDVSKFLLTFKCPLNEDVEFFIHNKAIEFEIKQLSATYLVHTGDELNKDSWIGFFNISRQSMDVTSDLCTKQIRKAVSSYNYKKDKLIKVDGMLLGQLAKHSENSKGLDDVGVSLLNKAEVFTRDIFKTVGGQIGFLECKNNEKIINFYKNNGYELIGTKKENKDNLVVMAKKYFFNNDYTSDYFEK